MRFSLRKVAQYGAFVFGVTFLNILISYNVSLWSLNRFDDRGKVSKSWDQVDNGDGRMPYPPDYVFLQEKIVSNKLFRVHRSAKSISNDYGDLKITKEKELDLDLTVVENRERERNNLLLDKSEPKEVRFVRTFQNETELTDVFISVKTTSKYHSSRINLILNTWHLLAQGETYFFSDGEDGDLSRMLGKHFVNTNCSRDHSRRSLSCKMAVEFDHFMHSRKRWFCHVDDDVYVNVFRLLELLRRYNHKEDWYLGKPSLKHPLEVMDRENAGMKLTFWFATGGAGFCISRSLALKMAPYASGGRFMTTAERIRLPDDCTIGYIVEYILKKRLTIVDEFHSHLEALRLIKPFQLKKQITLSYFEKENNWNTISVEGFSEAEDPTRMRSLHCFLYPSFKDCRRL